MKRGLGTAPAEIRRYLQGRGGVAMDPALVLELLEETQAMPICLRLARRICLQGLNAAEPFLLNDGLQGLVGGLLAGLRDVPISPDRT
jgi:hypothetical protein